VQDAIDAANGAGVSLDKDPDRALVAVEAKITHSVSSSGAVVAADTVVKDHDALDPTVRLLLAERATDAKSTTVERAELLPGERINASMFHEIIEDSAAAERRRLRPMPQRPFRQTRIGNRFHELVERRATTALGTSRPLFEFAHETRNDSLEADSIADQRYVGPSPEDDPFAGDASALAPLIANFEASRWANRQPIAVEQEVSMPFAGARLVCKLDAVYQNGVGEEARFEIVDWKAGRAPKSAAERQSRFLQLDLYRHAYAAQSGIDSARIDVTLFYVAEGIELTHDQPLTLGALERLWLER
jgi:DNA helicase-2/ATP-dependent DNA helicase PcrA